MKRTFLGRGCLYRDGQALLEGDFSLAHNLNAHNGVFLNYHVTGQNVENFALSIAFKGLSSGPLVFRGTLADGREVAAEQVLVVEWRLRGREDLNLHLWPRPYVDIGKPTRGPVFTFYVPNVLFHGYLTTKYACSNGSEFWRRDTIVCDLRTVGETGCRLELRQLPGYERAAKRVRERTLSDWTAVLVVRALDDHLLDFDSASQLADQFLLLLSLACGHRVFWVYGSDQDGVFARIRAGSVQNHKSFPAGALGCGMFIGDQNSKTAVHPLSLP